MGGVLIFPLENVWRSVVAFMNPFLYFDIFIITIPWSFSNTNSSNQPAHEKIGVVDAQWIVHQGLPSLGSQVNRKSFSSNTNPGSCSNLIPLCREKLKMGKRHGKGYSFSLSLFPMVLSQFENCLRGDYLDVVELTSPKQMNVKSDLNVKSDVDFVLAIR